MSQMSNIFDWLWSVTSFYCTVQFTCICWLLSRSLLIMLIIVCIVKCPWTQCKIFYSWWRYAADKRQIASSIIQWSTQGNYQCQYWDSLVLKSKLKYQQYQISEQDSPSKCCFRSRLFYDWSTLIFLCSMLSEYLDSGDYDSNRAVHTMWKNGICCNCSCQPSYQLCTSSHGKWKSTHPFKKGWV